MTPNFGVFKLLASPVQGSGALYAVTGQGLYKSTDGSGTGRAINRGLPVPVQALCNGARAFLGIPSPNARKQ